MAKKRHRRKNPGINLLNVGIIAGLGYFAFTALKPKDELAEMWAWGRAEQDAHQAERNAAGKPTLTREDWVAKYGERKGGQLYDFAKNRGFNPRATTLEQLRAVWPGFT